MVSTNTPVVVRATHQDFLWVTGSDGKAHFLNPNPTVSLVKGLPRLEDQADRLAEILTELYG